MQVISMKQMGPKSYVKEMIPLNIKEDHQDCTQNPKNLESSNLEKKVTALKLT